MLHDDGLSSLHDVLFTTCREGRVSGCEQGPHLDAVDLDAEVLGCGARQHETQVARLHHRRQPGRLVVKSARPLKRSHPALPYPFKRPLMSCPLLYNHPSRLDSIISQAVGRAPGVRLNSLLMRGQVRAPDGQAKEPGGVQPGEALATGGVAEAGEGQAEVDEAQRSPYGRCEHLPSVCNVPHRVNRATFLNSLTTDTAQHGMSTQMALLVRVCPSGIAASPQECIKRN